VAVTAEAAPGLVPGGVQLHSAGDKPQADRISVATHIFWCLIGLPSSTVLLTRLETSAASTHPLPLEVCCRSMLALPASEEGADAPFSLAWRAERNL
jgi:hypothetical protein